MGINKLAKLANLSDDAKLFRYDHGIWAKLKTIVHNAAYQEAVSKMFERRGRKRFSQEGARKLAAIFYDNAVSEWGVEDEDGSEKGTRDQFLDNMTSKGLDYIVQQMMADAGDHDRYRDDAGDAEVDTDDAAPAESAEGN